MQNNPVKQIFDGGEMLVSTWQLDGVYLTHHKVTYHDFSWHHAQREAEEVQMHFGLKGDYKFSHKQLKASFQLKGEHNNLLYSRGIEMDVFNQSKEIETFGIHFSPTTFLQIAQNGSDKLKRFAAKVLQGESVLLSDHWRPNNYKIHQVIQEIVNCPFDASLRQIFLWSKSLELLVLQAELYDKNQEDRFIKKQEDKDRLMEAKYFLHNNLDSPPSIRQLAKQIGINEYKLKKGFKELFGTTVFNYVQSKRLELARQYLLDTDKTAQEISLELGFSSPQHFNTAFKKAFQITPNAIRKTP